MFSFTSKCYILLLFSHYRHHYSHIIIIVPWSEVARDAHNCDSTQYYCHCTCMHTLTDVVCMQLVFCCSTQGANRLADYFQSHQIIPISDNNDACWV